MNLIRGDKIGEGSYGSIYTFKKDEKEYAVKRNIVDEETDFAVSLLELDILRTSYHPYVLRLESYSFGDPFNRPGSPLKVKYQREDKLHFIFEKAHCSLFELIEKNRVSEHNIKSVMFQILLSLEYLHHRQIVHRDIKPENLLYFEFTENDPHSGLNYAIKLCDFGLSKRYAASGDMTPGIYTVIYRPPEVCAAINYTYTADIWGVGIIFYELIFKSPGNRLFNIRGEDDVVLLAQIIKNIPTMPTETEMSSLRPTSKLSRIKRAYEMRHKAGKPSVPMPADSVVFDLLNGMLAFDHTRRLSATQALDHPYFDSCRGVITKLREAYIQPIDEPVCSIVANTDRAIATTNYNLKLHEFRVDNNEPLYPIRLFFHALSLFDRYIGHMSTLPLSYDLDNVANVCFYMAVKYFTSLTTPPSYHFIVKTDLVNSTSIAEIERYIIEKVCDLSIYQHTPYEKGTFDESSAASLYEYYTKIPSGSYTPQQIVDMYTKDLNIK